MFLSIGGVLPEDIAKRYLYDIVSGLKYCISFSFLFYLVHLHKVVHRDIKPENILVSKDDHCKISIFNISYFFLNLYIADFGVAHIFDTMNSTENSTQTSIIITFISSS